ncbi:hypothetical protein FHS51_001757 [Sphingobium wenxiniae]|uniref:hypothetical protein n=1 Tax=Sphingobium wenxiniae (strain DSM 21828 / CGMCC 1.7748 / JZ-1) TaxID=595605 RepID=UPI0011A05CF6|nr:hypothetical protein [Sphingobium wenxiniae]MBB6191530.1 hypothetical protein [Sphingobium wenxiniae]
MATAVIERLHYFKIRTRIIGDTLELLLPSRGFLGRPDETSEYLAGHSDGGARELLNLIRAVPELQQAIILQLKENVPVWGGAKEYFKAGNQSPFEGQEINIDNGRASA